MSRVGASCARVPLMIRNHASFSKHTTMLVLVDAENSGIHVNTLSPDIKSESPMQRMLEPGNDVSKHSSLRRGYARQQYSKSSPRHKLPDTPCTAACHAINHICNAFPRTAGRVRGLMHKSCCHVTKFSSSISFMFYRHLVATDDCNNYI